MKFSYNWLQDYLQKKLPQPAKLADLLTKHSFEVNKVEKVGQDWVLDVDVLANRAGDCLSHWGMAQEIAAVTQNKIKPIKFSLKEDKKQKTKDLLKVEILAKDLCHRYLGRLITGVQVGPSPQGIQDKLAAVGIRSINNVVDVTNFIMLELGQPMHAFDADRLSEKKIIVRQAKTEEKFTTLDQQERILNDQMLLIADSQKAIALAGIMGGANTEIVPSTKNIILESANFEAKNIRTTSKMLDMHSESSLRFEHSLDPNLAELAINRAAALIQQMAEGQIAQGVIDFYPKKIKPRKIILLKEKVDQLLGLIVPLNQIKKILLGLGLSVKAKKNVLIVIVPTIRQDLQTAEDLIEEIGRLYGYDKIKAQLPSATLIPPTLNEALVYENKIKDILAGLGFSEVYNYSFVSQNQLDWAKLPASEILNPVSKEQQFLRPSLIFNLLKNVKDNLRYFEQVNLFELGHVFLPDQHDGVLEKKRVSGVLVLKNANKNAQEFYALKGIIEALLNKLRISDIWYDDHLEVQDGLFNIFHKTKQAEIKVGDEIVGRLGKISAEVLKKIGIEKKVAVFELDFNTLVKLAKEEAIYQPPSRYPSLVRDISVLVERGTKVTQVLNLINAAGGSLVVDVDLFDMYEGEQLTEDQKSFAFHVIYQAEDRTLTEKEVDQLHQKIIQTLEEEGGWEVRK